MKNKIKKPQKQTNKQKAVRIIVSIFGDKQYDIVNVFLTRLTFIDTRQSYQNSPHIMITCPHNEDRLTPHY